MHATGRRLWRDFFSNNPSRANLKPKQASSANSNTFLQSRTKRPSPLVHVKPPRPTTIPRALFPNTTAWRARPNLRRPHNLRFVLFPSDRIPLTKSILPQRSPMHSYVQIVSTPTADTPGACLMLHFDSQRYLFGPVAEGTQRVMVQRKVSLSKIQNIFLTGRIDWQGTGGMLGMILTIAELKATSKAHIDQENERLRSQGKPELSTADARLNIHGGRNLTHTLAAARRFIFRKGLPLRPREIRHDPRVAHDDTKPDYEDENVRVWSVLLSGPAAEAGGVGGHRSAKRRKLSPSSGTDSEAGLEDSNSDVDQQIREAVVKDMFDSDWKLDTLREMRLQDVQLPAKLFVRNTLGHIEPYTGPLPGDEACPSDLRVLVRLPWPASQVEELPRTRPSCESICYVVKAHPRRGKFDPAAATALGVAKHDFKKLTAGSDVTGKDGAVVTPQMVMAPTIEGRGFAVVDLPSAELVDAFVERPEWSTAEIMTGVDTMYWILPDKSLLEGEPRLLEFMKTNSSMKHIVLGRDISPNTLALESPAEKLIKMNRVDPDRFPLPIFDSAKLDIEVALESVADVGRPGAKFQFAPKVAYQTDDIVPIMDTGAPLLELAETPQILDLADAARAKISDPAFISQVSDAQKDLPVPGVEIITLGTGSALPSKYRNVSATLVRVPGWGSYLFDCGENTLGQLRRNLGYQGADEALKDLRAIYISHVHADHHLGTVSVINRWRQLDANNEFPRLGIIATPKYHGFINEIKHVQPGLSSTPLASIAIRGTPKPIPGTRARISLPEGASSPQDLGLPTIEACFVDHCYEATAVVLTFPDTGLKIAYSGDCRPSEAFAELGRGAHLLLHECTFDDELTGDALAKKHSTLSEALGVGRKMEARRILLTHFSQRYPKLPIVNEESLKKGDDGDSVKDVEVLFAFDHMRIRLGEFKQAKEFLPALRELLKEDEETEKKLAERRARKAGKSA
ncbi:Ribonuclease Z 1 [Madurella mycetomatis]|uniref:ribonuclease Z n=1 Tax=Madurella mycetomatis TaxID=100816 RepID=A0A175W0V5_9PEZI|nr:Ribonuclease Z 1 [Madurella mycetomatis]